MKKAIIVIQFILIASLSIKGQILLDTIVYPINMGDDFYTVQIGPDETKYYVADTATNTFSLYNMDFTPFISSVAVPEPFALTSFAPMQVLYVSRTLFDCDENTIEYAYYSTTNITKPFRVMRTDGTEMFYLDSANGPFCVGGCLGLTDVVVPIRNTSDGAKLFLQQANSDGGIHIFSLCGSLPTEVFDFTQVESSIQIYPNPSQGVLNFHLPVFNNQGSTGLSIYDSNGQEVMRQTVVQENTVLNIVDLSGGTYYYKIHSNGKPIKAGKFILTK